MIKVYTKSAVVTKVKYQKIHSIPSEIGVFWETKYEGEGYLLLNFTTFIFLVQI